MGGYFIALIDDSRGTSVKSIPKVGPLIRYASSSEPSDPTHVLSGLQTLNKHLFNACKYS